MIKGLNKKGDSSSATYIAVFLIIALLVMVLIIYFVFGGFGPAYDWLKNLGSTDNVDRVKVACDTACSSGSVYSYCTQSRDVITLDDAGKKVIVKKTCSQLVSDPVFKFTKCENPVMTCP